MSSTITALKQFFAARGTPAYLVGGYLRDALMDSPGGDLDLAVQGDALALGRELAGVLGGTYVTLDRDRGVARIVLDGEGRGVDLTSMAGSIEDDLARRDFTIDALALPLDAAETPPWRESLIDPFGGRDDLARRLIRMVGPGAFASDPLRLLRAARLAAGLGFEIQPATAQAIAANAHLITQVSVERVRDELLSLLSLEDAKDALRLLDDLGLLCRVIPELEMTRGVDQPKEHYWDVFEHTLQAVGEAGRLTGPSGRNDPLTASLHWGQDMEDYFGEVVSDGHTRRTLLKLGALFHDIAKPQTKSTDPTGRTRFLGHSELGAEMAGERLRALRLSARGVGDVCAMVKGHLRPTQMSKDLELPTNRAVYRFFRDLGPAAYSVLYLSLADYLAARGPMLDAGEWLRRVELVNYTLAKAGGEQPVPRRERLVTGRDLIHVFGLEPGPRFRTLLDDLEEAHATGEVSAREQALAWIGARLERDDAEKASHA